MAEIVNKMISNDMILPAMRIELDLMAKQFEIDIAANLEIEVISDEDDNVKMLELVNEELSIEI